MIEQSLTRYHAAIEKGIGFVVRSQHATGWWHDFSLFCGKSDLWVTGYVGTMLMKLDHDQARHAATRAWRWLANQPTAGWGYNRQTPGDADSTLWCLQLAQALDHMDSSAAQTGLRFLQTHFQSDAGICTYAEEAPIRAFIQAPPQLSLAGWMQAHACVTNAAAQLTYFFSRLEAVLCASQSQVGHWCSYWWCSNEYATALAALALHQHHTQTHPAIERAAAWALTRLNIFGAIKTPVAQQGSAFATAWALILITLPLLSLTTSNTDESTDEGTDTSPYLEGCARCANWLINQQQSDGSWAASAGLRVPPSNISHPNQFDRWCIGKKTEGGISLDDQCLFTTATVTAALKTYQNYLKVHPHTTNYHLSLL